MERRVIKGIAVSPGRAYGRFVRLADMENIPEQSASPRVVDAAREHERFVALIEDVTDELNVLVKKLEEKEEFEQAEILRPQIELLADPVLHQSVKTKILEKLLHAEVAVEEALAETISLLEKSDNLSLAEKAADFKDVALRLQRSLAKASNTSTARFDEGELKVYLLPELLPTVLLSLREQKAAGFIVYKGSPLAHAIILAKLYGVPVVRISPEIALDPEATNRIFLNGETGEVIANPSSEETGKSEGAFGDGEIFSSEKPIPINLWLNIADPSAISERMAKACVGVGLYRTEVLFMRHKDFPDEEEQMAEYKNVFDRFQGKTVTVRTLDIGGDKPLPYFQLGPQENPYLGFRAHRIYHYHPEIFITQVKAILRAAYLVDVRLRLLYPMVETPESFRFLHNLCEEAERTLDEADVPYQRSFEEGVLIEVPSALWSLDDFQGVDFFSLGTNDLIQYFLAADRNSSNLPEDYTAENPVVLKMLSSIADQFSRQGRPVTICGEIASDPHFIPLLYGMGYRNISIDAHALPNILTILENLDLEDCKVLMEESLQASSTAQVQGLLRAYCGEKTRESTSQLVDPEHEAIDPICGMVVSKMGNSLRIEMQRGAQYFCSEKCYQDFLQKLRSS